MNALRRFFRAHPRYLDAVVGIGAAYYTARTGDPYGDPAIEGIHTLVVGGAATLATDAVQHLMSSTARELVTIGKAALDTPATLLDLAQARSLTAEGKVDQAMRLVARAQERPSMRPLTTAVAAELYAIQGDFTLAATTYGRALKEYEEQQSRDYRPSIMRKLSESIAKKMLATSMNSVAVSSPRNLAQLPPAKLMDIGFSAYLIGQPRLARRAFDAFLDSPMDPTTRALTYATIATVTGDPQKAVLWKKAIATFDEGTVLKRGSVSVHSVGSDTYVLKRGSYVSLAMQAKNLADLAERFADEPFGVPKEVILALPEKGNLESAALLTELISGPTYLEADSRGILTRQELAQALRFLGKLHEHVDDAGLNPYAYEEYLLSRITSPRIKEKVRQGYAPLAEFFPRTFTAPALDFHPLNIVLSEGKTVLVDAESHGTAPISFDHAFLLGGLKELPSDYTELLHVYAQHIYKTIDPTLLELSFLLSLPHVALAYGAQDPSPQQDMLVLQQNLTRSAHTGLSLLRTRFPGYYRSRERSFASLEEALELQSRTLLSN